MTIDGTKVHKLSTAKLEAKRDQAEAAGNWDLYEACEAELERRDYDASDPAAVAAIQEAEDLFSHVTYPLGSYTS